MFFFFKQKTAYEMRISDRSSDVCSSDLDLKELPKEKQLSDFDDKQLGKLAKLMKVEVSVLKEQRDMWNSTASDAAEATEAVDVADVATAEAAADAAEAAADSAVAVAATEYDRSEEHTSELQSLMRISYAVFCLKKKNNEPTNHKHTHIS